MRNAYYQPGLSGSFYFTVWRYYCSQYTWILLDTKQPLPANLKPRQEYNLLSHCTCSLATHLSFLQCGSALHYPKWKRVSYPFPPLSRVQNGVVIYWLAIYGTVECATSISERWSDRCTEWCSRSTLWFTRFQELAKGTYIAGTRIISHWLLPNILNVALCELVFSLSQTLRGLVRLL